MDDMQLSLSYAPIIHYDLDETIPLQRVGYTVFREHLAFTPTLRFDTGKPLPAEMLCTWEELKAWIPARIEALCAGLREADR